MKHLIYKTLSFLVIAIAAQVSSVGAADLSSLRIMTENFPPFNYSENGKPAGIAVERLLSASEAAGMPVTKDQISVITWARAYKTTLSGPNALLFSTTRSAEREDLFKWAGPIGQNRIVVWAKKSSNIGQIDDLSKISEKIVLVRDDIADQMVVGAGVPDNMIIRSSKLEASAKQIENDRAKLWAYSEIAVPTILEGIGANIDDYEIVHVLRSTDLYFAFSKDVDDALIAKLQAGIDATK